MNLKEAEQVIEDLQVAKDWGQTDASFSLTTDDNWEPAVRVDDSVCSTEQEVIDLVYGKG